MASKDDFWRTVKAIHERNADKDPEQVLADVAAAVEEVRAERYKAEAFMGRLKALRRDRFADDLKLIEGEFPDVYGDAQRFFELTGDVPWEYAVGFREGEVAALREKYHVNLSRQKPRTPAMTALFCEACDLLWLQKFPQD